ncbi:bacterial transduction protein [compost metagenome]
MIKVTFKKHSLSFILSLFFISSFQSLASDIKNVGVPFVENYSKNIYMAGNQNWSVVRDNNGVMYYGNSEGLLSYDGRSWQLYKMPNKVIVRSVATDNKGKVYAGGYGEFGYWSYADNGKFQFTSLNKEIAKAHPLESEIWKIYIEKDKVIFQSFDCVYIYQNGKVTAIDVQEPFLFLLKAGSRYFIEILGKGLYELKNSKLEFIPGSESLANTEVLSVLPYNNNFLIGTSKHGLYVYDGNSIRPWNTIASDFLKTYQLNNGVPLFGKYLVYGTILNGLIITDYAGNIIQHINKTSGLQNNTILNLYLDQHQNLWTGLDNGIDRIELNSPLYYYFDKSGRFGTVYSSIIHQDKVYIGTNQGLFYSDWPTNPKEFHSFNFKFVPNSQGQVWDLSLIDDQLISGTNEGSYLVNNSTIRKISDINGGWVIKKVVDHPDYLMQGTYLGVAIYKKDERGNWMFSHLLKNFNEPARYIEQDEKGMLWIAHAYKGVYRAVLSPDLKLATAVNYYDVNSGLPHTNNINLFKFEGRIIFSTDNGFYLFDDFSNKFKPYKELNTSLGTFAYSNKVIKAEEKQYWFINHGKIAFVDLSTSGKVIVDSNKFSTLNGRMVQYYENINRINKSLYLISVDDGFVLYNEDNTADSKYKELPKVLIRKIDNANDHITTIAEGDATIKEITLPYSKNNIRISFSLPYYEKSLIQFQYFLEGYSGQWSEWSTQTQKDFTNLSSGDYEFMVRARINGNLVTKITTFKFNVSPPWYSSIWAWIIYFMLAVAGVVQFRRIYFKKLERARLAIQHQLEKEQEEYIKYEAIISERKISEMHKEQLEADLASKNREMANTAMNIVYKNELLEKIKEEILNLTDSSGKKLSSSQLKKIQKVIDEGMSDDRDWNIFESSFNEAHGNFFKKLKTNYCGLVPNDLKLCAYLRMNMSSKEVASLLNITVRGVEIRRYRLRKKLNLPHDKNITEFLLEL